MSQYVCHRREDDAGVADCKAVIYLDSAGKTLDLKPPQVEQAVCRAFHRIGNAGRGAHDPTLQASRTVYRTREKLAELFHAGTACMYCILVQCGRRR